MPLRYKSQMRVLRPAAGWLNGTAPSPDELRGRPVLIHFWSLSVREAMGQISRPREWLRRFGGELQVYGVHTPLAVEDMDHPRVAAAVGELRMEHPTALDGDDGALADAYDVRELPAYFLFDSQLRLRNHRAGGRAADEMERILSRLFPRHTARAPAAIPYPPRGGVTWAEHR
ncbi:MAG TPA: hypothetical protein VE549_09055 [Myxococcaceae bacterium]|nr:hypothetical protein [Myxococcaceae bacterium]